MAKVGVKYPVYKDLEKPVGKVMGKAIEITASPESNDTKLYADDEIAESDRSFKEGSKISINVDDLSSATQAELLGHTYNETDKELICNKDDIAPYVAIGFFAGKKKQNKSTYVAKWYHKMQFGEPSDSNKTKGENIEFATSTIEGAFYTDSNGDWRTEREFETAADAIDWLKQQAGITAAAEPEG